MMGHFMHCANGFASNRIAINSITITHIIHNVNNLRLSTCKISHGYYLQHINQNEKKKKMNIFNMKCWSSTSALRPYGFIEYFFSALDFHISQIYYYTIVQKSNLNVSLDNCYRFMQKLYCFFLFCYSSQLVCFSSSSSSFNTFTIFPLPSFFAHTFCLWQQCKISHVHSKRNASNH